MTRLRLYESVFESHKNVGCSRGIPETGRRLTDLGGVGELGSHTQGTVTILRERPPDPH